MQIEKNSRQVPKATEIVREKYYCDLLYVWLQNRSERVEDDAFSQNPQRRIHKSKISWAGIERDFTRTIDGETVKEMSKRTIAKYFQHLVDKKLITLKEDGYYYLTVLDPSKAILIEQPTLLKLEHVLRRHSIDIYVYLFNRYYAERDAFLITFGQIKNHLGIATTTSSNNAIIADTLDILKRLKLLDYEIKYIDYKTMYQIKWVANKLPESQ